MNLLALACCLLGQASQPTTAAAPPAGHAVTIAAVDNPALAGILTAISPQGQVTVTGAGGAVTRLPLEDVIRMTLTPADRVPDDAAAGTLFLVNGDRLRGRVLSSDHSGVTFQSALLGRMAIHFDQLRAYVPPGAEPTTASVSRPVTSGRADRDVPNSPAGQDRPGHTPDAQARAALLAEVLARASDQDHVYVTGGDVIPGVIEALTPDLVVVSGVLGRTEHPGNTVRAVTFAQRNAPRGLPDALYAQVTFIDGSTAAARVLSLDQADLTLEALAGFNLTVKIDRVSALRIRNGRVLYLSETEPASVTYVPYYNRVWPLSRDTSVWGNPLTVKGETFPLGLGLAPRTTLVYALDGAFERLLLKAGIDDETEGKGLAVLTIDTDQERPVSLTLAAGKPAIPVDVPLAGVKRLTISVDFGPDDDAGDHVDLGNARLIRLRRDPAGSQGAQKAADGPRTAVSTSVRPRTSYHRLSPSAPASLDRPAIACPSLPCVGGV